MATVIVSIGLSGCGGRAFVSMNSLPLAGQWRIVAQFRSGTAAKGGCQTADRCVAYGVISPLSGVTVDDAQAALVERMRARGWACIPPHPGGSIALVASGRRTWVEMQPVDKVDTSQAAPWSVMWAAASTSQRGTVGLAMWIASTPEPIPDSVTPFVGKTCPTAPPTA